jgi:hypothetical protein
MLVFSIRALPSAWHWDIKELHYPAQCCCAFRAMAAIADALESSTMDNYGSACRIRNPAPAQMNATLRPAEHNGDRKAESLQSRVNV